MDWSGSWGSLVEEDGWERGGWGLGEWGRLRVRASREVWMGD